MVLHTLVVDPLQSGRGLGSAFVRFYEAYALEQGYPYLCMDTNEKNKNARALYARLGYREAGIVPCTFNGIPGVNLVCLEKPWMTDFTSALPRRRIWTPLRRWRGSASLRRRPPERRNLPAASPITAATSGFCSSRTI